MREVIGNNARAPFPVPGAAAVAGTAALVCGLCFLGSTFDSAIVFPRIGTAILFPPYAILTAAMLFSPVRHWWILFAASALGNYAPHRHDAWVLLAEAANFVRVLVAAGGMRFVVTDGRYFDSLRGVSAFLLFAVSGGPFVAAFVGAGIVVLHVGLSDYWLIWQAWFLSNALTALTLLPIIVMCASAVRSWPRHVAWRPSLESGGQLAVLFIGLFIVGILVFAGPYAGPSSLPVRLYAPLPFILWAAVRFGPAATSAALLGITSLTIWGALHEHGPFVTQSAAENLLALQFFLLAISLPSVFLGAVMEERRRAFAALTHSEQEVREQFAQLATIYHAAPVGLAFVDTELRYVGVNDCLAEVHGLPVEAHLGRTVREALPHLADAIEPLYRLVLATGEPVLDVEMRGTTPSRPGSQQRSWLVSRYPVKDGQGSLLGVSTVAQETTERKEIEEVRQELAHASRVAMLGELTATIAHEINQPLGAILSNADAAELLLDAGPASLPEVRQILEDIRRDDLRASEVIRRLRTLLRKHELEIQPIDPHEVIAEVLGLIRAETIRRGVAVATEFAPRLPTIHGDKVHLQQVLLNLLLNGMEAMANGQAEKRLTLSTREQEGGAAEIAVSDQGSGIPPEQLSRVFDRFFTTKKEGLGLGLAIARSLVEAHGGRIWAENRPAGGATFRFTLPGKPPRSDGARSGTRMSALELTP